MYELRIDMTPTYEDLQDIFEEAKDKYLEDRKEEYDFAMNIKADRAGIQAIHSYLTKLSINNVILQTKSVDTPEINLEVNKSNG